MHPAALGELMEVPFMSWCLDWVQLGTLVTAAPGAMIDTPGREGERGDIRGKGRGGEGD